LRTEPPGEERSVDEMVIMSCPKAARVCRLDDAFAGDPTTIPPNSSVICTLQAGAKLEDENQMAPHSSVNRAYMMNLVAAPPPRIIIIIIIISFPDPQCACKEFPCPNCQKGRSFNSSFLAQLRLAAAAYQQALKIHPPKFLILYNFPLTEMCDVLMHRLCDH